MALNTLEELKRRALLLGIKSTAKDTEEDIYAKIKKEYSLDSILGFTDEELKKVLIAKNLENVHKKVRVSISCNDIGKAALPANAGEFYSFGNDTTAETISVFVPNNTESYHIPVYIYDIIKNQKIIINRETGRRNEFGIAIEEMVEKPKYNITMLSPLTTKELKDLKDMQTKSQNYI